MKTNTIQGMKLETECRGLKKRGETIRDIARLLSQKHHMPISASAVHRFLKKEELKQAAAPIKIMKINLTMPPESRRSKSFVLEWY